ncbi:MULTISPECIES: ATP-grasp domain-containing protein [unclassified Streptomyces]|uniref:ATP-grasp domain-containing protein n=1 Tax=unclassified Streptomyces TaxID=2593676 RepID=UPI000379C553|nr:MULTISPECIES: ATP-grasp domain-containing protein [unclassified Streptomyces]MYT33731.1 ATP-grasp domain-containing protein [Streptomyces sp. SID8354]
MKLLALEALQNAQYYLSRYQQVEELGAELYVLNGLGEDAYWPAERYRVVGSQQIDDIVAAARTWHAEEHFEGVLTFSEAGVVTVAAVAEALGLPGIGLEAARTSRNKYLMRRAHEKGGVPIPAFRLVSDLAEAHAAGEEFGYPVILKPTLGAASNFVFRVEDADDMTERFAQALDGIDGMSWYRMEAHGVDLGPQGLLIESFLDGREFLCEAVAWDGEVYLGSVVDRVTVEGDTFDDDVHAAPTSLSPGQIEELHRAVRAGVRAQGVTHGVLHAEVRYHQGAPHILEIAVRPGGGGLDHIARLTAGHCPIRALMDTARGVRPKVGPYTPTGVHIAGMALLCDSGRIERVDVPAELADSDKVFFFKITARPGDLIRRPPEGNSILGFLGVTGTSFEDAMRTATDLANSIDVHFAP